MASISSWIRCAGLAALLAMASGSAIAGSGHWEKTAHGITVTPASGKAAAVTLGVMADGIFHVTAAPAADTAPVKSLMVTAVPDNTPFDAAQSGNAVAVKTAKGTAEISLDTGAVTFRDAHGNAVLSGFDGGVFKPSTVKDFYWIRQEFNRGTEEGFYGLGQHQNRMMNYNGRDVELAQHNMDVAVPFVVSTQNYGVLWDNDSITRFGDAREYESIDKSLKLYDANGDEGGLTGQYYVGDALKVTRTESDPNYQYIRDQVNWPSEVKGAKDLHVVWDGKIESDVTGPHEFRFYVSGAFKLFIDGKLVLDGWRQNWNPLNRPFTLDMLAGLPQTIHIEWTPQNGYLRLLHLDPLPDEERHELSFSSDVAKAIDYYVIVGSDMDGVVAGYRKLTGKAVLLPRWAYGFWQSRQRYETQDQLLGVLDEYRKEKLPLDAIVQDWLYWPEDAWGSHDFDRARFPDPAAMVKQVHGDHAHIMLSVWPKFYTTTANYKELDAAGYIYRGNVEIGNKDWVGPGYLNSNYDPYSQGARDMYWRQIWDKLGALHFDAFWLDNDEPDVHSNLSIEERMKVMGPTAMGSAAEYFNTFPLMHVGNVYDHWHAVEPDTRHFILTRSGFGGLQRYAAAVWSGDVTSRWSDMRDQISAGVNFSMSGIPNWSFDIGGYTMEDRYAYNPTPEDLAEWTELYTRWFEFGAFVPVFRSHGELRHREIFEVAKPGTEIYNTLALYDRLRYRLMPYIYAIAAGTYTHDSTMMRGLVMDFPADKNVWGMGDEYMFGPAFLVAPVTEYQARTWPVYLPAGQGWYDFFTGKKYDGGQTVTADAALDRMPLFVKVGSIVPTGPAEQYTGEKPGAPITLYVFTGANGRFDLYDDDGTTYGYQRGQSAVIPIAYDDATGTLTIGARQGSYPGMPASRKFNIRWFTGAKNEGLSFDAKPDAGVTYSGSAVTIRMRAPPRP